MSKKALCIGINDYPGTQNDLSGCVNDANDWAAALAARNFSVTKLLDAQATKAAMVGAISALVGGAAKGDTVEVAVAGDNADTVLAGLIALIADGFGED